jgi:hypothetical protein
LQPTELQLGKSRSNKLKHSIELAIWANTTSGLLPYSSVRQRPNLLFENHCIFTSALCSLLSASNSTSIPAPRLPSKMYVSLQVDPRFWFNRRAEVDSRLSPSPSIQALKVVRDTNKKHLGFIAQHEKKLLQRMDPEDANQVYMQLGLKPPGPGEEPWSEPSDDNSEPYRRGDLEPISVAGLRSHHHPVPEVKAQALATWKSMREDYYKNQQPQETIVDSWAVQDDSAFSEADSWTTQETPISEGHTDSSNSSSVFDSASDCDDEYTDDRVQWDLQGDNWWDSEADCEKRSGLFPELPGSDHWLTNLPTPPPSDNCSSPSSPVLSEGQLAPTTGVSDPIPSTDSSVSDQSVLSASEELFQVLNDRKIMEAFLDGIVKRIKESYMSKSEKEAEKAVGNRRCRTTGREGRNPRGEGRGDPRRPLRLCRNVALSPKQVEQHILEKTCKAHFEIHFQMTHQYEDAVGKVHAEPVATQGVPPENRFEWMKTHQKRQTRF